MLSAGVQKLQDRLRACCADRMAAVGVEFALILPVLLTLMMYGAELAHLASVRMQVSEIATSVADNASRLGQSDNSAVMPTVTEVGIASILYGALQQGAPIDITDNGRVVLSSLELDGFTNFQFIAWQRCVGELARDSDYGKQVAPGKMPTSDLGGMGSATNRITAPAGSAVMYVEVFYRYRGLFGTTFVNESVIKQEAAFLVRDDRNLTPRVSGSAGPLDTTC